METKRLQPDAASIQFTLLSVLDVLNDCGFLMVKYYSCNVQNNPYATVSSKIFI